jgi:hypothetical protein
MKLHILFPLTSTYLIPPSIHQSMIVIVVVCENELVEEVLVVLVLDVVVVTVAAGLVVDSHPHGFGGKLVSCLFAFSINYSHRQCFRYPKPNQDEDLRWLLRNKQQSR